MINFADHHCFLITVPNTIFHVFLLPILVSRFVYTNTSEHIISVLYIWFFHRWIDFQDLFLENSGTIFVCDRT